MTELRINDKKFKIPENWDEVSMKLYCNLFHKLERTNDNMNDYEKNIITLRNEAKILSRVLGEDDEYVQKLPLEIFGLLRHELSFLYEIDGFLNSKTFYINIDGKRYYMPQPNEMSLRQFIDADIIMKEKNKNQFIELLACLLLPIGKDGKYVYDGKYQDLIPKIEKMSASDGLPFIYTFFKKKQISKNLSEAYSKVEEAADQLVDNIKNS